MPPDLAGCWAVSKPSDTDEDFGGVAWLVGAWPVSLWAEAVLSCLIKEEATLLPRTLVDRWELLEAVEVELAVGI
jgi:hypothetical protein